MIISTFNTTDLILFKLNRRENSKGVNFTAIPENRPKVRFSKMPQNSALLFYNRENFTGVFSRELRSKSWGTILYSLLEPLLSPRTIIRE